MSNLRPNVVFSQNYDKMPYTNIGFDNLVNKIQPNRSTFIASINSQDLNMTEIVEFLIDYNGVNVL